MLPDTREFYQLEKLWNREQAAQGAARRALQ
jgi:ribosomal silencing factor RsfS